MDRVSAPDCWTAGVNVMKEARARLTRQAGDLGPDLVQRLACGYVESLHVRTAERIVRDEVFRDRNEFEQFALRRDDVDACLSVESLRCSTKLIQPGGWGK